jgi:hypothetical protein
MRLSVEIGRYAAAFAIGITLASIFLSFHQRNFVWLPLFLSFLLLHPAWTMGVFRGDCGEAKRFLSGAISLVLVALLICQIFFSHFSRRQFLLTLCALCWVAYLPFFLRSILHFPIVLGEGFVGRIIQSFVLSSNDLLRLAVTLTVISLVLWLVERIRREWKMGSERGAIGRGKGV